MDDYGEKIQRKLTEIKLSQKAWFFNFIKKLEKIRRGHWLVR